MDDLERLMTQYADWIYVLLFAYAFVKTGPLPVAAAYAATLGWLHAGAAFAAVAVGAFLGDQVRFELGRRLGPATLRRFPRWATRLDAVVAVVERHHAGLLTVFRFAKGIRTPVSLCMGMTRLTRARFASLNAATAVLWSGTLTLIGTTAGVFVDPERSLVLPIAGLALMSGLVLALGWGVRRELARRIDGAVAAAPLGEATGRI
jgi:membrane protein DedA with SNARE-associated domain